MTGPEQVVEIFKWFKLNAPVDSRATPGHVDDVAAALTLAYVLKWVVAETLNEGGPRKVFGG